ncbi:MAG: NifB/NifX family molybdenum-iron cluster-binding protein [Anaerotignum sp.]
MKKMIGVPYKDGTVFQHFGHSEMFKIYTVENNAVTASAEVATNGHGHGLLAEFLDAHDVSAVICGGIGDGAKDALTQRGIALFPGVSGEADQRVQEYLDEKLVYNPDTKCKHHHGEHHHGEHHHDGHECGKH